MEQALGLTFTEEQRRIVFGAPEGPAVVMAGAGSGKTAVMAARIVALVVAGHPAAQVLGLTFTRKAAGELADRVAAALALARDAGLVADDVAPTVATYHSFAQSLVRDHGLVAGVDPDLRVETAFALAPMATSVVANSEHLSGLDLSLTEAVRAMRQLDSECAEHAVSLSALRSAEALRLEALEGRGRKTQKVQAVVSASRRRIMLSYAVGEYREAKRRAGVMDFPDMMRLALEVSGEPTVRDAVRQQWTSVLLDEYQDTSVVQRLMIRHLFGDRHRLLAVGDPKQSIYGFRGAAVENIELFDEHFATSEGLAGVFELSVNFRSGPTILEIANTAAASRRAQQRGRAGVRLQVGRDSAADQVQVGTYRTQQEEAEAVVALVAQELREGRAPEEVLVLLRNNEAAARFAEHLRRAGIPAVSSQGTEVFDTPVVRDVLAVLAAAVDPAANSDVVRMLAGPRWQLGLRDLAGLGATVRPLRTPEADGESLTTALSRACEGSDPADAPSLAAAVVELAALDAQDTDGDESRPRPSLPVSHEALNRLRRVARVLREVSSTAGEPITEQIARILALTGLDTQLLLGEQASWNVAAVDALYAAAAQYERAHPRGGAAGFLRAVELARELDADPGFDPPLITGSVRVLTVHKAKGLEAEVVVLPEFDASGYDTVTLRQHWTTYPGRLPDDLRGDRPDESVVPLADAEVKEVQERERALLAEENDRLTYVALTRARDRMVITCHHWREGRKRARLPAAQLASLIEGGAVQVINHHAPADDASPFSDDAGASAPYPWFDAPMAHELAEQARRVAAARTALGTARPGADAGVRVQGPPVPLQPPQLPALDEDFTAVEWAQVERWDSDIAALWRERIGNAQHRETLELPPAISVTGAQQLLADPLLFAAQTRRPMPRRPSARAELGTRFHEWVAQRWGQTPLWPESEFAADADLDAPDPQLEELIEAFERSPLAQRAPYAVEQPFAASIGGRSMVGRIDAVYDDGDGWLLIDWKVSAGRADPTQLAIYRVAWAKARRVPLTQVRAGFCYLPSGDIVVHDDLPDEAELASMLDGATQMP